MRDGYRWGMSFNKQLSAMFDEMAGVLQLLEANRFKIIAFQKGSRTAEEAAVDLSTLCDDIKKLTALDGIGKGLAEKIIEFHETGRVEEFEEAKAQVPEGVIELLGIPGLGPKTAAMLWKQADVESVDDLKAKIESGELEGLPRLGKKSLENICKSIEFTQQAADRSRIGPALRIAQEVCDTLSKLKEVKKIDFAGSLRRGKETIGDVDVLAAVTNAEKHGEVVSETFRSMPIVTQVLAAGATKSSVRTESGIQIDLRVVEAAGYGAALMYFTGSKEHNVQLRERAIKLGLRLNEYGLWQGDGEGTKGTKPVAAKTEDEIYKALGLALIDPALREARGEIDAAEDGELPKLIDLADIQCELHAHTTASDGKLSIEELAAAAKAKGYHTIAVTDHSQSQPIANGLSPERLLKHIDAIHAANEKVKGIQILAGSEVDILSDGSLDYEDEILEQLDIVVASPHHALSQEPKAATKRLLKAIEHPCVNIIGHPTGRLIGRREGLSPDMGALIKAAAECGTALEINSSDYRLDLRDTHAKAAIEAGVLLAINTDAHAAPDLENIQYGVLTARRAWATTENVVNTFTRAKLDKWLKSKRG